MAWSCAQLTVAEERGRRGAAGDIGGHSVPDEVGGALFWIQEEPTESFKPSTEMLFLRQFIKSGWG